MAEISLHPKARRASGSLFLIDYERP